MNGEIFITQGEQGSQISMTALRELCMPLMDYLRNIAGVYWEMHIDGYTARLEFREAEILWKPEE